MCYFFNIPCSTHPRFNTYPQLSHDMVCYVFVGPAELRPMCLHFKFTRYAQSPASSVYAGHSVATIRWAIVYFALSCMTQFH